MVIPVPSLSNVQSLDLLPIKVSEVAKQQSTPELHGLNLGMFECVLVHPQTRGMVPGFARP